MEKEYYLQKISTGTPEYPYGIKMNLDPYVIPQTKINLKWTNKSKYKC